MADGTTKPIDQINVGDHIANAVPGQSGTQDNTVTHVIITKTDHDFVNLTIKPLTTATASTALPPTTTATKSLLKKAAASLAAAVTALGLATAATTTTNTGQPAATGDVTEQGGTLTTTFHHPFYDITQAAFIDAQNLKTGDELQTPTGHALVTAVHLYHANTITYDLTIGNLHTYYVVAGDTPVLVHNSNNPHTCEGFAFDQNWNPVGDFSLKSGDPTAGEQDLGGGYNTQWSTHTEARAMRMVGSVTNPVIINDEYFSLLPLGRGDNLVLEGQLSPCPRCMGAMRLAAKSRGINISYIWRVSDNEEDGYFVWQPQMARYWK